jgi:hypothetical protein
MPRTESQGAVRPLTVQPERRTSPRRLPLAVAGALLIIGASAGYLLGLPNDSATPVALATTTPPSATPASQMTPAHYDWFEQQPTGEGQQAWDVYAAVELDDDIYLLVADDQDSRRIRVLWRSSDGETWDRVDLGLGPDVTITDLDVYRSNLLLSGWDGDVATVWQSQELESGSDPQWLATPLPDAAPGFGELIGDSTVSSQINNSGEIVVSAEMGIDITDALLELPASGAVPNLLSYRELPEVAVADSRLWMRIVTADGDEEIHTQIIPSTIRVTPEAGHYGTEVGFLTAGALWISTDGELFETVDLGGLAAAPSPQAFNDIFFSVFADSAGTHELWTSADGSSWLPSSWIPPTECGDWQGVAVGGSGLLLTSDGFDTLCLSGSGTDWEVRQSKATAVSTKASVWIEGDDNRYLALARNSAESAVLTSSDGFHWNRVEFTQEILSTSTFLVGDRLVTSARPMGTSRPRPLVVWVGQASDQ